ncbi:hypothetical protein ES703_20437 [subsurface metagenome]
MPVLKLEQQGVFKSDTKTGKTISAQSVGPRNRRHQFSCPLYAKIIVIQLFFRSTVPPVEVYLLVNPGKYRVPIEIPVIEVLTFQTILSSTSFHCIKSRRWDHFKGWEIFSEPAPLRIEDFRL